MAKKRRRTPPVPFRCSVCPWSHEVETHHVIPTSHGGADEDSNVVALCPNHHALAHSLFCGFRGAYHGPRSPAALIDALRIYERDPTGWMIRAVSVSTPPVPASPPMPLSATAPTPPSVTVVEPVTLDGAQSRAFKLLPEHFRFLDAVAASRGVSQAEALRGMISKQIERREMP